MIEVGTFEAENTQNTAKKRDHPQWPSDREAHPDWTGDERQNDVVALVVDYSAIIAWFMPDNVSVEAEWFAPIN